MSKRDRVEREMAEEMRHHMEARAADLERQGVPPADAARQARLEFGATARYQEECRESLGYRWADELRADVRYAWRQWRQNPSFAILAVALLGVGIGANTALFSTVDAVMLRSLPVREPEQLRRIEWVARRTGFASTYNGTSEENAGGERVAWSISHPVYQSLRAGGSFSELMAFSGWRRANLTIQGQAQLAGIELVSGNFFSGLGTGALLGRTLLPDDDRTGAPAVTMLSYGYWDRMLGADPGVVGKGIAINGAPATVVGVLPRGMCGVNPQRCPDLFAPLSVLSAMDRDDVLAKPGYWSFEVMGRLKPGVSVERARAETQTLLRAAIAAYHPGSDYDPPRVNLTAAGQGVDRLRQAAERPFQVLSYSVAAVLFIACANLAGVLLARAAARQREMATRLSLGAGRARLLRQLLTESLLLAFLGGAVGLALAAWIGDGLARLISPPDLPLGLTVALNPKVLAFSLGLCTLTGLLFGLAPAARATRVDPAAALKSGGAASGRSRFRLGKALIGVQVALSLVLAVGASLLVRTLVNLRSLPTGFQAERLLVFQLNPTLNGYRDQRLLDFHEDVLRKLTQIPGVSSASMSRWGLLAGSRTSDGVQYQGRSSGVDIHYPAPRFLETWGIPLLAGRDVSWSDRENSKPVLLVNQALAAALFRGENPVGRVLRMNDRDSEIIGVTGDAKFDGLRRNLRPAVYVPFRQHPQHTMTYVIRASVDPPSLIGPARSAVASVDADVPLFSVKTQIEQIDESIRRERILAYLLSGFAGLALLLAGLGVYGTLAYLVARRTPEIGLRLALGARPGEVVAMVMRESALPVAVGIAAGLAGAFGAGQLIESMLYGLKPRDTVSIAGAAAAIVAGALIAAWWPARRAAGIAPTVALRHD